MSSIPETVDVRLITKEIFKPQSDKPEESEADQDLDFFVAKDERSTRFLPYASSRMLSAFAQYSAQGLRPSHEDAEFHVVFKINDVTYNFDGVCDGHGGHLVAKFAAENLPKQLMDILAAHPAMPIEAALELAFKNVQIEIDNINNGTTPNEEYNAGFAAGTGTTVTSILTRHNRDGSSDYFTANLGDARTVVYEDGTIYATKDHKPTDAREKTRLEQAGLVVWGGRVGGSLAVSRALGDNGLFGEFPKEGESLETSSGNSHIPTIEKLDFKQPDFFIVACDGLWDVYESKKAVAVVKSMLDAKIHPQLIAAYLVKNSRVSRDNVSVILRIDSTKYPYVKDLAELDFAALDEQASSLEIAAIAAKALAETIAASELVPTAAAASVADLLATIPGDSASFTVDDADPAPTIGSPSAQPPLLEVTGDARAMSDDEFLDALVALPEMDRERDSVTPSPTRTDRSTMPDARRVQFAAGSPRRENPSAESVRAPDAVESFASLLPASRHTRMHVAQASRPYTISANTEREDRISWRRPSRALPLSAPVSDDSSTQPTPENTGCTWLYLSCALAAVSALTTLIAVVLQLWILAAAAAATTAVAGLVCLAHKFSDKSTAKADDDLTIGYAPPSPV